MANKQSSEHYIPTTICGNGTTHLSVSLYHEKKDYNHPARYIISTTPCTKTNIGWCMGISIGIKQPYDTYLTILTAPRFNVGVFNSLINTYMSNIAYLLENKVDSTTFENKLKELAEKTNSKK